MSVQVKEGIITISRTHPAENLQYSVISLFSFTQHIFTEKLLCSRHIPRYERERAGSKRDRMLVLIELTFWVERSTVNTQLNNDSVLKEQKQGRGRENEEGSSR